MKIGGDGLPLRHIRDIFGYKSICYDFVFIWVSFKLSLNLKQFEELAEALRHGVTATRVGSGRKESRGHADLSRRGPKSGQVWRSSPDTYVHSVVGNLLVAQVTAGHVVSVLLPIWSYERETARRAKQRIPSMRRWAVAKEHRTDDPPGVVVDAASGVHERSDQRTDLFDGGAY